MQNHRNSNQSFRSQRGGQNQQHRQGQGRSPQGRGRDYNNNPDYTDYDMSNSDMDYGSQQGYGQGRFGSSNSQQDQYGQQGYSHPQQRESQYGNSEGDFRGPGEGHFGQQSQAQTGRYGSNYGSQGPQSDYGRGSYDYRSSRTPGGSTYGYGASTMGSAPNHSELLGHRGKGPKNYKRSDERIREQVCEALEADHRIDASEIEVQVEGGIVTLTGMVEERSAKRVAEDLAEECSGVSDVKNEIRISTSSNAWGGGPTSTSKKGLQ